MSADGGGDEVASCRLVGPFSILVQVVVGTLGFSTLILKRYFERRRRPWLVWSFDVSKQAISGSTMHMCNLLVSALNKSTESTNPCAWYVLNLTLDCTLGIGFIIGYLSLFGRLARRLGVRVRESGDYGVPPDWREWAKQGTLFLASMVSMKLTVVALVALFPSLVAIGRLVLAPVWRTGSARLEIVFVMAIWPLLLNIFESWVIDQFIKGKSRQLPPVSASGHVPLDTEDSPGASRGLAAAGPSSFEMHRASPSSGSRTLPAQDSSRWETRLSLDDSDFDSDTDAGESDAGHGAPAPAKHAGP
ncbi:hypothetical protein H4R18_005786 [Coemansia javaensis]|uniref:Store-operated calcium entry regulator STIMATE n=1 Tax=Coemansia javaensis TaxID=2761396 RepID=A0A9W8LEB3_9FUNG|nr:hypothetical protein H4R18_005786 [Coemansia javaensis]